MQPASCWLPRASLPALIDALNARFERLIGPCVVDATIQFVPIHSVDDLPLNITDNQSPGSYRLQDSVSPRRFNWAVGPQALKPLNFAPRETLWRAERDETGRLVFQAHSDKAPGTAVIGVRACDLAALDLQDRHFLGADNPDPHYAARRDALFLVAVHCSHPADTCFCASTGDGPAADQGFDLALHELDEGFVINAGSGDGQGLLEALNLERADEDRIDLAKREQQAAAEAQHRSIPAGSLFQALFDRLDHPRWDHVGGRCLSCGNCTAVCPSCFCAKSSSEPTLEGGSAEHVREWDSCFSPQHSAMAGHQVRSESKQRYRQWLTHKLGGWHEQFGRGGCVGCGRCITWCPVGIDITEELHAVLAESPHD